MRTYIRSRIPGASYFFTLTLADRRTALLVDHVESLRTAFRVVSRAHPFTMEAVVVMPEHLHCIWTLPGDDTDYSLRWQLIKSTFSRSIPPGECISKSRARRSERGIWQRRYWEHVLRDERDYERHVDYIHFNPVKHGYANTCGEWPYSSFRKFLAAGVYADDWEATRDVRALDWE